MFKFFSGTVQRLGSKMSTTRGELPPGPHDVTIDYRPPSRKPYPVVEAKNAEPTADSVAQHAGPLSGEGAAGPAAGLPARQHLSTGSGTSVSVEGEVGQESISLRHSTGAAVEVRPDGTIFLQSTGKKGFGMVAAKGDGTISAGGRVIIDADELIIQSKSSIQFHSGGAISMHGTSFQLDTTGSAFMNIDGSMVSSIGQDNNHTVGGTMRTTVAGDIQTQTPGQIRNDSQNFDTHATQSLTLNSGAGMYMRTKGDAQFTTTEGQMMVAAKGRFSAGSTDGEATLIAKTSLTAESGSQLAMKAKFMVQSVGGNMYTDVGGSYTLSTTDDAKLSTKAKLNMISGDMTTVDAGGKFITRSGDSTSISAQSQMFIDSMSAMDIRGSTIDLNKSGPISNPPESTLPVEVTTPRARGTIYPPVDAKYPDAKAIVGSMITAHEIPDFPYNAKKMSSNEFSTLQNEGGSPNPKAEQYTSLNAGAGTRVSEGGSYGEIPTFADQNNSVATESPFPAPSGTEAPESLSRNVTAFPGYSDIPKGGQNGASKEEIIKNIQHLSHNIIDPLIEHFGSTVKLTSGFRIKHDKGNSNHYIGKAIDLRSSNRNDYAATAAIAKWAVDNLPFDRIFLEKNNEGGIHVHLEAAPAGGKGKRTVWTCADPKCQSRVDGLQLSYAVRALQKSKKA